MSTFSILGTGNMAKFMAQTLRANGQELVNIWGRNSTRTQELALLFETSACKLQEVPDREDHYCLVAVKDSAIQEVVAQLRFEHTVLVHHAGSISSKILASSAKHYAVLWPIYSITAREKLLAADMPFALECSEPMIAQQLASLIQSFGAQVYLLNEQQRFEAHLCAVLCNNFCNHLIALAQKFCKQNSIDPQCLQPILQQTFDRLKLFDAQTVQTGPARRNDSITMKKHLDLLKNYPELQAVYSSLSGSIMNMYKSDAE